MFRSLILDWSGTLVDDSGPTLMATNAVLTTYGKEPMTWEEFRRSFRLPYSEWYEEHVPGISLRELEEHFRKSFDASEDAVIPLKGTRDFLEWCSENEIRLFVLTSMNSEIFGEQMRRFGFQDHFEDVYSGVLDKRKVIAELIEDKCLVREETAYVGDMLHDLETAYYGGVSSVAVLSGYDALEKLETGKPTFIMDSIKSLHAMLKKGRAPIQEKAVDWITVRRLAVDCFIGVPDDERARRQTLHLTVDIMPDKNFSVLEDQVENTVDYDAVAKRIIKLADERPRKLIETLSTEVAEMVLHEFPAKEVVVEVEKKILPRTDCVLVKTRRTRRAARMGR